MLKGEQKKPSQDKPSTGLFNCNWDSEDEDKASS